MRGVGGLRPPPPMEDVMLPYYAFPMNYPPMWGGYPPPPSAGKTGKKIRKTKNLKLSEIKEIAETWNDLAKKAEEKAKKDDHKKDDDKKKHGWSLSTLDTMLLLVVCAIPLGTLQLLLLKACLVTVKEMLK
jgi:hypothetical protein